MEKIIKSNKHRAWKKNQKLINVGTGKKPKINKCRA